MNNGNDNATPMECKFQLDPFACDLDGYIKADVIDLDTQQPSTIIDCNDGGIVRVEWGIRGPLAHHLCGEWCVCVYLESIGPGPEVVIPDSCRTYKWEACHDGPWVHEVRIPGGVDCGDCGKLYIVGVTLTSKDGCYHPGHIAAYCKGPTIMFYEGHPDPHG